MGPADPAAVVAAAGVVLAGCGRDCPPGLAFHPGGGRAPAGPGGRRRGPPPSSQQAFWSSVAEKVVLVLVTVVFVQVLDVGPPPPRWSSSVAVFVTVNALVSQVLARRGHRWGPPPTQFLAMGAVNAATVGVLTLLRGRLRADADPVNTLFLVLARALIITLYDRYRTMRERPHHPRARQPATSAPASQRPDRRGAAHSSPGHVCQVPEGRDEAAIRDGCSTPAATRPEGADGCAPS